MSQEQLDQSACLPMTSFDYDWDLVHEQIVSESFNELNHDEAVALVGLLANFKIVFSRQLREHACNAVSWEPLDILPLELDEAVRLVAFHAHLDQTALKKAAFENWTLIKESPLVIRLRHAIEAHRFVERLVPWSEILIDENEDCSR